MRIFDCSGYSSPNFALDGARERLDQSQLALGFGLATAFTDRVFGEPDPATDATKTPADFVPHSIQYAEHVPSVVQHKFAARSIDLTIERSHS